MKFYVIASGSNGNSAIISTPEGTIIIDAGISRTRILEGLKNVGVSKNEVIGVLATHHHTDHTQGLPVLLDVLDSTLHCTEGTRLSLSELSYRDRRFQQIADEAQPFSLGKTFNIGDFAIESLPTKHDADDSTGYRISHKDDAISIITDTGELSKNHLTALQESSFALVEMNHDIHALQTSRRPSWLKKRIRENHLANDQMLSQIESIIEKSKIKAFFVGHISGECNSPQLVSEAIGNWSLKSKLRVPWNWYLCPRDRSCGVVELRGRDKIYTTENPIIPSYSKRARPKTIKTLQHFLQ